MSSCTDRENSLPVAIWWIPSIVAAAAKAQELTGVFQIQKQPKLKDKIMR